MTVIFDDDENSNNYKNKLFYKDKQAHEVNSCYV